MLAIRNCHTDSLQSHSIPYKASTYDIPETNMLDYGQRRIYNNSDPKNMSSASGHAARQYDPRHDNGQANPHKNDIAW